MTTSDLVRRLREHPARYGGPTLEGGIWATMLEAADRLEAYETAIVGINANIANLNTRYSEIVNENAAAAKEIDDLALQMQRIRSQTIDRDRERQRIMITIGGLRQALQEIAGALPLSVERADPSVASAVISSRADRITEARDILNAIGPDTSSEPAEHFDNADREDQATQDAAPQPGSTSGRGDAAEGGGDEKALHEEAAQPATA